MKEFIMKYMVAVNALAFLILIFTGNYFSSSRYVIAGQLLGLFLMIFARASYGSQKFSVTATPKSPELIQRGYYRILRHPMYSSVLVMLWAGIAGHWKVFPIIIGIIDTALILWRIELEERLLRERYSDYADYSRRTRKIIPFIY